MISGFRWFSAVTRFGVCCGALCFGQNKVLAADPVPEASPDHHRVLVLTDQSPLLIDVRLETGSQSLHDLRTSFCESLFKRLDADQSGVLEAGEFDQLPTFRRVDGVTGRPAEAFAIDGKLTPEGLLHYINEQLGPVFAVETRRKRLDQSVQLLELLDANQDGLLSVEEVVNSPRILSRYDLDDDESVSVSELQPYPQSVREAMRQQQVSSGEGVNLILITDAASLEKAVEKSLVYQADGKGIPLNRCGVNTTAAAKFDRDSDGHLAGDELKKWLSEGTVDLQIHARWNSPGQASQIQVTPSTTTGISSRNTGPKFRWEGRVNRLPVQIRLDDNRASAQDSTRFLVLEARRVDRDMNNYLDETEFSELRTDAPFKAVDSNRDGMIVFDEVRQYFTEMNRLSQARVVLTFSDEVPSLFQIMDEDRSNRLTLREMTTLTQRVPQSDRDENGILDAADFISQIRLVFSFAVPEGLDRPSSGQMTGGTQGVRTTVRSGPLWFLRMDRNRDNDVSWREFLGPRSKFDALDTNHDGLINKEEAEAAEPTSNQN